VIEEMVAGHVKLELDLGDYLHPVGQEMRTLRRGTSTLLDRSHTLVNPLNWLSSCMMYSLPPPSPTTTAMPTTPILTLPLRCLCWG
jgi:hypothetical protein